MYLNTLILINEMILIRMLLKYKNQWYIENNIKYFTYADVSIIGNYWKLKFFFFLMSTSIF